MGTTGLCFYCGTSYDLLGGHRCSPTTVATGTAPLRERPGDQPLPIPNDGPCVQDAVIADLEARKQVGIQRYGTVLQPHNGRDALRDAYEEALDLATYLRQALMERGG